MTALGFVCVAGAVLFFGSNYLPVKTIDVGDGFFFQWCLCAGIWLVGIVVALAHPYSSVPPPMEPLAVLGGVTWATGHVAVPFIIQQIGMAKGLIVWGSTAMLAGWACGVFGLLGVQSQAAEVHSWTLNVAGLSLSLASLATSLLLRPETTKPTQMVASSSSACDQALPPAVASASLAQRLLEEGRDDSLHAKTALPARGVALALLAGLAFGVNFNGAQYVMDRAGTAAYPGASQHALDYVPSQFSGIFLASTIYFALYAGVTRNRPDVRPNVALPALASGVLWGVADALWFVANEQLGFIVAFPIVLSGPGIVASLWGIFFLGELKGRRNMLLAAAVAVLVSAGATLISLSRA